MPVAVNTLREAISYRRDAYTRGLQECGFDVTYHPQTMPKPEDVLLVWNRSSYNDKLARRYEQAGARVLVTENGWIGSAPDGGKLYALCRDHHNGAGTWYVGEEDRWSRLGVELKPWRTDGRHVLVLGQRSIGEPGVASPRGWEQAVMARLRLCTQRPVRLRPHPGPHPRPPMDPDLADCWAVVTWNSGGAIRALAAGVPVFYEHPKWIGSLAAKRGIEEIENPFLGLREPMFKRLAWAQWSADEIATGEPFGYLLTRGNDNDVPKRLATLRLGGK